MEFKTLRLEEYLEDGEQIRIFTDEVKSTHELHAHDFIEIAYVTSGKGEHIIGDRTVQISKGDLFLINAHVFHGYKAAADNPIVVRNCIFDPLYVDVSFKNCKNFVDLAYRYTLHSMCGDDSQDYIRLTGLQYSKTDSLLSEMQEELSNKQSGYDSILKNDLKNLLIYIFREYINDRSQKQNSDFYKQLIVQNAASYIKSHYKENIKCEQLSSRLYISPGYLAKTFKEITGITITDMLQNLRINVACSMLENSKKPIETIAHECGYSDMKFFYKLFKRKKGLLPGEYRKKYTSL